MISVLKGWFNKMPYEANYKVSTHGPLFVQLSPSVSVEPMVDHNQTTTASTLKAKKSHQYNVFSNPGNYQWVVPANVTEIFVTIVGGGG